MRRRRRARLRHLFAVVVGVLVWVLATGGAVWASPEPYGQDDGGGFRDVLALGAQLPMYRDLIYGASALREAGVRRYFKDATFGVAPADVARIYSPRDDVTIVRDRRFDVPHVFGASRQGAMFGLGYAAAEDRLFLMDILRHEGRAQLSSLLGGAYRGADEQVWRAAAYTEADLTRQVEMLPRLLSFRGELLRSDMASYIAGVNQFIAEARLDPAKLPVEYQAIGRPQGPEPWRLEDIVATAALVAGFAGAGGGDELAWARVYQALRRRFGRVAGATAFDRLRASDDARATVTVPGRRTWTGAGVARVRRAPTALPDPGSLQSPAAGVAGAGGPLLPLAAAGSSAVVVPAGVSRTHHPLLVAGLDAGYRVPAMVLEEDAHAPTVGGSPGIDARGVAIPGLNFYVEAGRGRDFAWSGSPSAQDVVDTFAVYLCDPSGARPSVQSGWYEFRGGCVPMQKVETTSTWQPTPWDPTPAGTQTLTTERTVFGAVVARATVHGRPVAYTRLRSTYFHELDSAVGFQDLNEPAMVQSASDFEAAVGRIGWAFNWVYSDPDEIGYATSGAFPVRAPGVDPGLPIRASARNVWRGWDPSTWTARTVSPGRRPHVVDPRFIVNWGNKPARGWRSPGDTRVGLVDLVTAPLRRLLREHHTIGLAELIRLTTRAASTDLRAYSDLPLALRVLGRPAGRLGKVTAALRDWQRSGALRRPPTRHGASADTRAVAVFDRWWPRWLQAEFAPAVGDRAFAALRAAAAVDAPSGGAGAGTAYTGAWPGYVSEDLRRLLQPRPRTRRSSALCGRGVLWRCRLALRQSLRDAITAPPRRRTDAHILIRTLSGRVVGRLPWADRPSYQQAVSVQRRVAPPPPLCGPVRDVVPARTVVPGAPPLIIGDSVLLGALTELAQAGFEVDAHACRHVQEGLDDLQARAAAGTLPKLIMLELGTDGTVEPADIDRALAILGPGRVLALVTPREAFRAVPHDARVMRQAASRYPGRVLLLDWVATSAGHDDWFQPDGIHLTPAGAAQFAALASRALPWA